MTMRQLLVRRLPQTLLVAVGVGLVAFFITRLLPGDPASTWAGPRASREELALVREQLGLDLPLPEQAVRYLIGLASGDWGISIHTRQPVIEDVMGRLVASLELVGTAMLIALIGGLLLGMIGARWKGRWPDWITSAATALLVSAPIFWLGLLLQLTVATELDLLPVAGRYDREFRDVVVETGATGLVMVDAVLALNGPLLLSAATHVLLPALVVAAYPTGLIARLFRASLIETLGEEHVRMARAIGFNERTIVWRFALRSSLGPVLAALALVFGYALANTFLVENLFDWPGLGSYVADSITSLDAPSIAGATVVVALAYLIANLVVDLVRPLIDPRLRA